MSANKVIEKNSRIAYAQNLPKVTMYNARSLFPKILSLATDMEERSIDICCVSEIWEKAEDKVHQGQIESLLELNGIKYISNPRRGRRRGGTAIAARCESFSLSMSLLMSRQFGVLSNPRILLDLFLLP